MLLPMPPIVPQEYSPTLTLILPITCYSIIISIPSTLYFNPIYKSTPLHTIKYKNTKKHEKTRKNTKIWT